jgi:hypothetical protein
MTLFLRSVSLFTRNRMPARTNIAASTLLLTQTTTKGFGKPGLESLNTNCMTNVCRFCREIALFFRVVIHVVSNSDMSRPLLLLENLLQNSSEIYNMNPVERVGTA